MSLPIPGPAYRIVTPRLVVRCWHPADASLLKPAIDASLPELKPWIPWWHEHPQELGQHIDTLRKFRGAFDLGQDYAYGLFDPSESEVLGGIGLMTRAGAGAREIGYWIASRHAGKGLATEAAGAVTQVAFTIDGVTRVEIHCDPGNKASARVAEKLGFMYEATLRRRPLGRHGGERDLMVWTLFADEFPHTAAANLDIQAFDAAGRRIEPSAPAPTG